MCPGVERIEYSHGSYDPMYVYPSCDDETLLRFVQSVECARNLTRFSMTGEWDLKYVEGKRRMNDQLWRILEFARC